MAYTIIDDPTIYFNTKLYTGNGTAIGSGGQAITGVNFQPDWVWVKSRSLVDSHQLYDVVRGGTKGLRSDTNAAEGTNTEFLSTFDSDGFTVGNNSKVNQNSETYVAWNWKAGGSASSNSNGSITSTVSANTTAGFSIVSYTGTGSAATIGHGLGAVPACYFIKQRNTTGGWIVYHKGNTSSPETDYLRLDKNDATVDDAIFNDTAPTSSVFSIGTNAPVNTSSGTYIAYCFAEKKGYSKFGSFTGNGNNDGTFVYTGFKPAFVIAKNTGASEGWSLFDNKRSTSGANLIDDFLVPSSSEAEISQNVCDFVSNGIKFRHVDGKYHNSGGSYIFMAFAESPFTNSSGVPNNAR